MLVSRRATRGFFRRSSRGNSPAVLGQWSACGLRNLSSPDCRADMSAARETQHTRASPCTLMLNPYACTVHTPPSTRICPNPIGIGAPNATTRLSWASADKHATRMGTGNVSLFETIDNRNPSLTPRPKQFNKQRSGTNGATARCLSSLL